MGLEGGGGGGAPGGAVECAVGDGFSDVGRLNVGAFGEVGDGACHAQYAVVGACRHVVVFHGIF